MLVARAARDRRRPGLLPRRRAARRRARRRARERRLGGGRVGGRRGRRVRRAASSSCAPEIAVVTNVELDHHSRWGSRAELTRRLRALRAAPRRGLGAARRRRARPGRRARPRPGGALRRRPPGAGRLELRVPGRHNVLNARAALAALELAGFELEPGRRGARALPRDAAPPGAQGRTRAGPRSTTTTPTTRPRSRRRWRRCASSRPRRLIAVFQPHLYSRTKALAARFGAALAAADEVGVLDVYAGPRAARWASSRASAGSTSPGRPPTTPAGRPVLVAARRRDAPSGRSRPRLRRGRPAGDDRRRRRLPARRRPGGRERVSACPTGVERDYPLARLTTVRAGGRAELFARPRARGELVELLRWAEAEGARGRGGRLGLEPAGRRRRRPRAGAEARRRADRDRARRRARRLRRRRAAAVGRREGRRLGARPGSSSGSTSRARSAARCG